MIKKKLNTRLKTAPLKKKSEGAILESENSLQCTNR